MSKGQLISLDQASISAQDLVFDTALYYELHDLEIQSHAYQVNGQIVLSLQYVVRNDTIIIADRAPYQLVSVYGNAFQSYLRSFYTDLLQFWSSKGIYRLYWKLPPVDFFKNVVDETVSAWESLAKCQIESHPNHYFELLPSGNGFTSSLHQTAKRKYEKSRELVFKMLPDTELATVYQMVSKWRALRGHQNSMTLAAFEKISKKIPNYLHLFAVCLDSVPVAICLAVRPHRDILYYFYPASDPLYDEISPAIRLVEGMHAFARKEGIRFLDLGTSYLSDGPNKGLLQFKDSLGANRTMKHVLKATWS